jgi:hypothetical protein
VAKETKGKTGVELVQAIDKHLTKTSHYGYGLGGTTVWIDGADTIRESMLSPRWVTGPDGKAKPMSQKLRKPLAKTFEKLKLTAPHVRLADADIGFTSATHDVHWYVPENNHACETAHDDPVAKELFRRLGQVKWVRGTGGEIVGNDEHNRESREAGNGGNFVKRTFGLSRRGRG